MNDREKLIQLLDVIVKYQIDNVGNGIKALMFESVQYDLKKIFGDEVNSLPEIELWSERK